MLIIISSILLCIDSPLDDPNSELQSNLRYLDYIVTFLFVVECVMKVIRKGFIFNGKKSYLRSYWNSLDFFIIIISLIGYIYKKYYLNKNYINNIRYIYINL